MGADQDMPQAGFVPASLHDEIRLPLFGTIDLQSPASCQGCRFVPARDGRRSFQVVFVRRMYCGQEEGSEEEGRQESREEARQEGSEESGQEVGWCGWRFAAIGPGTCTLVVPGQGRGTRYSGSPLSKRVSP